MSRLTSPARRRKKTKGEHDANTGGGMEDVFYKCCMEDVGYIYIILYLLDL